ncbi:MAG: protein kinase [Polyangiaceae bacterium]|nr:protein kinase [Polyangiaceae bacterium]
MPEAREDSEAAPDVDALGATEVVASASDTTPDADAPREAAGELPPVAALSSSPRGTVVMGQPISDTKLSPTTGGGSLRPFGPYGAVEELSSQGAMGIVARAYNTAFDRWELVKFLREEHAARPELVRQFEREGKVLARLSHPNVVTVFAVYQQGGRPCLAMEFLQGESLGDLIERDGPLPIERASALFLEAARGLAAAHEAGLLHRDLKPDNLFVVAGKKGSSVGLKLIDFGLATADRAAAISESSPQLIADIAGGTPLYMAPEQWRGGDATPSTDLFGLGLSFHVALAGRLPFDAASTEDVRRAMLAEAAFPDVRTWRPEVPRALAEVVARAIHRAPEQRFASADDLVGALVAARAAARPRRVPGSGPYRGLMTFSAAERDVFFGRDAEVAEIVERLRREPGLVVVGPSGAGKSSLVHAGVAPAVLDGALGSGLVFVEATLEPRERPLASLAASLGRALGKPERDLYSFLAATPAGLGAALAEALPAGRGVLVVIDQLEELATLATDAGEVGAFCKAVGAMLSLGAPSVRVIATVRADLLDRLFSHEPLRPLLTRGFHPVRPLRGEALRRAVIAPAEAAGYTVEEPALVDEIVADADKTDAALPLVSFVMASWWALRDEATKLLPSAAYRALGGLTGALARHGDALFEAMSERERAAAEHILVWLVSHAGTRVRVDAKSLVDPAAVGPGAPAALAKLLAARLVVESGGKVEIVHESLATKWPRLSALLQVSGEDRAYRDRVSAAAREWEGQGRPEGMLWSGDLAERLFRWVEDTAAPLGQSELAFYEAVRRRRDRRRLVSRSLVISITLSAVIVTLIAKRSERDLSARLVASEALASAAASSFKRSEARLKRAEAAMRLADDPPGALSLAHESWELHHDPSLDVIAWQARALGVPRPLPPHPRGATLVAISANGAWLASAGASGSIHVLSSTTADHASFRASATPYGMPRALALSRDGARLAVGTTAGEIVSAAGPEYRPELVARCAGSVDSVAVAPRAVIATCPADPRGAVRVVPSSREVSALTKGKVVSVSLADDADVGAWLTDAGAIGVFSPTTGETMAEAQGLRGATVIAASPRGERLFLGAADGVAYIVDVGRGALSPARPLAGRAAPPFTALTALDEREVLSLSRDGVWRTHGADATRTLGTAGLERACAVSRRKHAAVMVGRGGEVAVRSTIDGSELGRLRGATLDVSSVALDAAARLAVVGARDGGVRVYSLAESSALVTRSRAAGEASCLLSPDGAAAACASRVGIDAFVLDGSIGGGASTRVVSRAEGEQVVAVSPRGEHVATSTPAGLQLDGAPATGADSLRLGAYSPDGAQIALAGRRDGGGRVELRRVGSTRSVDLPSPPNVLLWSHDGSQLLVGLLQGGVALVDALGGKLSRVITLSLLEGDASALALSDDGGLVAASGTSGKIVLVRADGTRERLLVNLGAPITCVAFSQDGRAVVAGATAARVAVSDVDGGGTFTLPSIAGVAACARSPIGDRFSFVGPDGSAWIRALDFSPLVAQRAPDSALDAAALSVDTWRGLGWKLPASPSPWPPHGHRSSTVAAPPPLSIPDGRGDEDVPVLLARDHEHVRRLADVEVEGHRARVGALAGRGVEAVAARAVQRDRAEAVLRLLVSQRDGEHRGAEPLEHRAHPARAVREQLQAGRVVVGGDGAVGDDGGADVDAAERRRPDERRLVGVAPAAVVVVLVPRRGDLPAVVQDEAILGEVRREGRAAVELRETHLVLGDRVVFVPVHVLRVGRVVELPDARPALGDLLVDLGDVDRHLVVLVGEQHVEVPRPLRSLGALVDAVLPAAAGGEFARRVVLVGGVLAALVLRG